MSQGWPPPPGEPVVINGRDDELRHLRDFVDQLRIQSEPLLLSGDAGVGKTMLLDAAAQYARAQGYRVVHAAGVEFEADVGFATLHLVLQPLFGELENLTEWHRDALTTALGLREGPRSDQLVLSNATLAVLAAASSTPLLLIVDDLPWIDRASAAVLGFVARRLSQIPVGLLAASRTGKDSFLDQAGVPTRLVPPLTDTAAHTLLASRYPAMSPRVRQRLLTEAQGNPLALLELPAALQQHPAATGAGSPLPAVLPLSGRLQATFAARVQPLPPQTRHLLLAAVLDGTGDLAILDAVAGSPAAGALAPAERAGLIRVDYGGSRVTFRHPLIRSAVVHLAAADERRAVHSSLAAHHSGEAARRAWHLAQAATGPDEDVAALLQSVAHVNLWRGDSVGAIGELLRAAALSPAGADRARRLAEAGPNEQADRRAAAPVAPHGGHTSVPDLPETRRHFKGGTTRRVVRQRRSKGCGRVGLTRRPALSATPRWGPRCCTPHEHPLSGTPLCQDGVGRPVLSLLVAGPGRD